jgi:hypothetical protein
MVDIVTKVDAYGRERVQEKDFDESRRVVRVVPKNADIRKYIKHPRTKVGFLAEGSAEWPNDTFTKRRIADGDVTIEAPASTSQVGEQRAIEQKTGDETAAKSET